MRPSVKIFITMEMGDWGREGVSTARRQNGWASLGPTTHKTHTHTHTVSKKTNGIEQSIRHFR